MNYKLFNPVDYLKHKSTITILERLLRFLLYKPELQNSQNQTSIWFKLYTLSAILKYNWHIFSIKVTKVVLSLHNTHKKKNTHMCTQSHTLFCSTIPVVPSTLTPQIFKAIKTTKVRTVWSELLPMVLKPQQAFSLLRIS